MFLISLIIIFLIALFYFFNLKTFLISPNISSVLNCFIFFFQSQDIFVSLIVVSIVSFFNFLESKKIFYIFNYSFFFRSLDYILWKKSIIFLENKSLLDSLKSVFKILIVLSKTEILSIMQIMMQLICSIFISSNTFFITSFSIYKNV